MVIPVDNRKFSPPREFNAPAEGFFWNWVPTQGFKKVEWWGYQMVEIFKIGLAITGV